ncbi:MAG: peptidylprolyl isomerase [Sandaracinaceae bacterium]|nr:peptidylprolyl isomerase [Sandaracinaceae bacterium]
MASGEAPSEGRAQAQPTERRVVPRPAPRPTPAPDPTVAPRPPAGDVAVVEGDQRAPDTFTARLDTTAGNIDIEVHRDWSPHGADRFYTLVREGYFSDVAFFRVIDGFMAQGGIHGDPNVASRWRNRRIPDDPVVQSNRRGFVSFAMAGPGTRTTQFFINLVDNTRLDGMGFSPFGQVREMSGVTGLYSGYGEGAPSGRGPAQGRLQAEGNTYLRADFPELDYIRSASIL